MTIWDCWMHVRMTMTWSVEQTDLDFKISVALVYTVCHSICICLTHHYTCMWKPHFSNFRINTAVFWMSKFSEFLGYWNFFSASASSRKSTPTKRQKKLSVSEGGVTYPIDLWFQLSRYIHPESVRSFALICRGTRSVIHSVQFWKTTYLRYFYLIIWNFMPKFLFIIGCVLKDLNFTLKQNIWYYNELVSR